MLRPALAALLAAAAGSAPAGEVRVAVAANFSAPMKRIAASFEQTSGNKVQAVFGATGKFYAQIGNGAPFEVLLAADEQTPQRLAAEGHAVQIALCGAHSGGIIVIGATFSRSQ